MPSGLVLVGNENSYTYNTDKANLFAIGRQRFTPSSSAVEYLLSGAPISLVGGSLLTVFGEGRFLSEAFVLTGVEGTYNPAQPDTPAGIAKTYITLIDPNKNKNRSDDACP